MALTAGCDSTDDPISATQIASDAVIFHADSAAVAATVVTETGLTFIPIETGNKRRPGRGAIVSVHYTGMLADGTIFDDSYSRGSPFRFALGQGQVIAGWDEGIALMGKGDKARLVIPPQLAYGDRGAGSVIPSGATLTFDVWLVDVQ
ncbi:MAG: FKBP-type peptidyl-prolyl cis-trans isomerase [Candidatus Latescibacterota bacterium]|nr:FKBP-type peptidyl-prolyl cis-trans isomerase [Candidatus Latescibacterota bacterium]